MMPFEEDDIRLTLIIDTIKETLEEHGMHGWRADDPERRLKEDVWDNIVVNMLSCKYGIAVFVDRTLLDRYTDEQVTMFNANIALEVGFMKSRGLDVLLLKDKRLENLPTDIISKLGNSQIIIYHPPVAHTGLLIDNLTEIRVSAHWDFSEIEE